MTIPTHDTIAVSAYFAWEAEGRPFGRHDTHWLAAEAALRHASPPVAAVAAPTEAPAPAKAVRKTAAKKPALAKAKAPSAPAETVVAAAALATPRVARGTAKGTPRTH